MSSMRVALLVPAPDYPEPYAWTYDVEAAILGKIGIEVAPVAWTEVGEVDGFDLILPLVAWGYDRDYPRWLALLKRAEVERWPLLNPPALLRWNGDKTYLRELGAKGIPTVTTIEVGALNARSLGAAAAKLGAVDLVVKPPISGGAFGTYRLRADDPIPDDVAGQRMMIQTFQPTITAGEWSIILFGGKFSHAVIKTPAAGIPGPAAPWRDRPICRTAARRGRAGQGRAGRRPGTRALRPGRHDRQRGGQAQDHGAGTDRTGLVPAPCSRQGRRLRLSRPHRRRRAQIATGGWSA